MPTYEYKCDACGFGFEKFQSIKAKPIRKCPNCGKNRVKRLIGTGGGLIFKGGGFYQTDYRSEAYKSAAKADNGSPPASKDAKPTTGDAASKSAAESKPAAPAKPAESAKPAAPEKPAKSDK